MRRHDPRSRAGLSFDTDLPTPESEHPFDVDEQARYERDALIGVGGMGEVHAALDVRLDREIALKRATRAGDIASWTRLSREARITAGLEHPGIVPVYDAGIDEDGAPFYTMRLIRGRSLADVLREAPEGEQASLVRAFLAVCEAVAYAHSKRVVHRDLKPSNVMIGDYGRVVVVDWGLAVSLDEPRSTTPSGTEGYASPEQMAGAPPSPADDVYALGVMLEEIAAASDAELRAIAAKARAAPGERYPDAAAVARDVQSYLEGRRVTAHRYTARDLARRFLQAFRVPLAVGAFALLAGAVALTVAGARLSEERARAVDAEGAARRALDATDRSLFSLLEAQSALAYDRGSWPEAEVLAAHALARGASPIARGVLAASAEPDLRWGPTMRCARPLAARGRVALCDVDGAVELVDAHGPRWRVDAHPTRGAITERHVAWLTPEGEFVVADLETGRILATHSPAADRLGVFAVPSQAGDRFVFASSTQLVLWRAEAPDARLVSTPCDGANIEALVAGTRTVLAACPAGRGVRYDLALSPLPGMTLTDGEAARVSALALDPEERVLAVGDLAGRIRIWDLDRRSSRLELRDDDAAIVELDVTANRIIARDERGAVRVSRVGDGALSFTLPASVTRVMHVAGDELTVAVTGGTRQLTIADAGEPPARSAPAGLAGAAVAPNGRYLAVARGDGRVAVLALGDEASDGWERVLCDCVVKRVDFSPDGRRLAVALAAPDGLAVLDAVTGEPLEGFAERRALRRVAYLAETLVTVGYGDDLALWSAGGERRVVPSAPCVDIDVSPDSDHAFTLGADGAVHRLDTASRLRPLGRVPGAVAVAHMGQSAILVTNSRVLRLDDGEPTRSLARLPAPPLDVDVTNGDEITVGLRDGTTWVLGLDGTTRAILRGHRQRVSHVLAGEDATFTASWDGTLRRWRRRAWIEATPPPRDVEARWATPLDQALRALSR